MYIRNKSGLIQECHNEDVIRSCRKDTDHFTVSENLESLIVKEEVRPPEERQELEKMKVDELRAMAKERGIEGAASLNKEELLAVLKG
ncbi:Rho termination factor N-terminal domain-containing protein [Hungatella hathewayi]|uniref:Rho termination factor N-terminal domain-containing protein n=1 Tax=Hungatella hathewayi TaxID=154046 RepID=UPI003569DDE5